LRMLEQYLGEERFRDGVRHYLKTNAYANTETTDLWDAIEHVVGEPVRQIMDGWIFRGGFPLVSAQRESDESVSLQQSRFTYLPVTDGSTATWDVPVLTRVTRNGETAVERVMLGASGASLPTGAGDSAPVVNAGGHGFFRVRYDGDVGAQVAREAHGWSPIERYGLISDTWASVVAGTTDVSQWCDLAAAVAPGERDANVWSALVAGLGAIDQVIDDGAEPGFHAWARELLAPALSDLGWEPHDGEPALRGQLRGSLLAAAGAIGDDASVIARGAGIVDAIVAAGSAAGFDPEVAGASVTLGAIAGGRPRWEAYRAHRQRSDATPQEAVRYLQALGAFSEEAERDATLALTLTDEVRGQDVPYLVLRMLNARRTGPATWAFLEANWDGIVGKIPGNTVARMLEGIVGRSEPEVVARIEQWFRPDGGVVVPHGAKLLSQSLERMRVQARLRDLVGPALTTRFA
jgi:puromycin-sensitive aminopeptidase